MGFINRFKAYLNEDDEPDKTNSKPGKKTRNKTRKERVKHEKKQAGSDEVLSTREELDSVRAKYARENELNNVKDFCEQLIDVSGHMRELDREYRIVTEYLTDIQKIEELPVTMAQDINSIAEQITLVDSNRQKYLQSENLLSVERYNLIDSHEDEIVTAIKNLNDMEMRDSMLKSDMGHLEGEKEDLSYMRNEYKKAISTVRAIIITTLVLFLVVIGILLSVAVVSKRSVTIYALGVGVVAMLSFAIAYAKYVDIKRDLKDADAKIKRAVSLLNKVKVKYINNTNTVDYIYNKYMVNSAAELEYLWEQYNIMIRDSRKYCQANNDLRVLGDRLVEKLSQVGVADPDVWIKQADSLCDRSKLAEIKHGLTDRRQKLKDRIIICHKINDNAKTALRAAVSENPGLEDYIKETLLPHNITIDAGVA